jgi:hypothetical protein
MDEGEWAAAIVIANASQVDDAHVARMAEACRLQVRDHVEPAYGLRAADIQFVPSDRRHDLPPDSHVVMVFDDEHQAQQEGFAGTDPDNPQLEAYGVGTVREGLFYARVFVNLSTKNGVTNLFDGPQSVSCSVSHEVVEWRIDPSVNRWAVGRDGRLYAYEACDAVENDAYPIPVDGQAVSVSNFVLPRWFDPQVSGGRCDYQEKVSGPFECHNGGYVLVYDPRDEKPRVKMEPDEGLLPKETRDSKRSPLARTRWRSGEPGSGKVIPGVIVMFS